MILGANCTRDCGFCSVNEATPGPVDDSEPEKVAEAAEELGLRHVVVTSVSRDDLTDGGAGHFARTISAVRERLPHAKIEVLTPDFNGDRKALNKVIAARPDIFNHNIETVERLYPSVRPRAYYSRSLYILKQAKETAPEIRTKSGLMLGLGETYDEIIELLHDLRACRCDLVTIGQYLRPTKKNLPVVEYLRPEVFNDLRLHALEMGFSYVASGPLVRSSMNAEEMYKHV
jgi:lipoic acid synthetase